MFDVDKHKYCVDTLLGRFFDVRAMDLIVQMLPASLRRYSTHMDYVGQQKAERIMQVGVVFRL